MNETSFVDCCIVGLGARTPAGLRATTSAAAIRAGLTRLAEHPYMVDLAGNPLVVAMDRTITESLYIERMIRLARSALFEAMEGLPLDPQQPLPVYLGLPQFDRFFSDHDSNVLCRRLVGEPGTVSLRPVPVPEGNASGVIALERAIADLLGGVCACCLVAGVDSFLDPDRLDALDKESRIVARSARWGFSPGEGAGALAVCTATFARTHRLPVLAWIAGIASAMEPSPMHTQGVCTGDGLARTMLAAASRARARVTKQYCDVNGERYREHEQSYAILRVPETTFVDAVDYVAPASSWGHVGAASIPLLAILPIVAHARGFSPGPWPMIWSGSESGLRGAVVLRLPEGGH
jgi:3-oxoacyl-[acyl-carrier-protein] synthase-1